MDTGKMKLIGVIKWQTGEIIPNFTRHHLITFY